MSDDAKALLCFILAGILACGLVFAAGVAAYSLIGEHWFRRGPEILTGAVVFIGCVVLTIAQGILTLKLSKALYRLLGGDSWRGKYR